MLPSVRHTLPLRTRGNRRSKWLHTLLWEGVPEGSQLRTSNNLSKLDYDIWNVASATRALWA